MGDKDWQTEWLLQEAQTKADREEALADLAANRERRARAEADLQAAREELAKLLARGQEIALDVAEMARVSGISRDTAHRRLREVGSISRWEKMRRQEKQRWQEKQRRQEGRS